jgi:hypothetical protein
MAAEAEELHIRPLGGNYKTCLTRIGLLMEGLARLNNGIQSSGSKFVVITVTEALRCAGNDSLALFRRANSLKSNCLFTTH